MARKHRIGVVIAAPLILGLPISTSRSAAAAAFTVTTTADIAGATCSAVCSLREAVGAANSAGGSNTIGFAVDGTFTLLPANGVISVSGAQTLTINGNGTANTTIDGGNATPGLFTVHAGTTATFNQMTLQHGASVAAGGAINADGTVTVSNSLIQNNTSGGAAFGGQGGGIDATGSLTVINSTITGNTAAGGLPPNTDGVGGGIIATGSLTITGSHIDANRATASSGGCGAIGGGIEASGSTSIDLTTLSNNATTSNATGVCTAIGAAGAGLDLWGHGQLSMTRDTVAGNTDTVPSSTRGSGVGIDLRSDGTVTVSATTISGNQFVGGPNSADGAGVYIDCGCGVPIAAFANDTIADNSGAREGGAFSVGNGVELINDTLSGNAATLGSGIGAGGAGAVITVVNTILDDAPATECFLGGPSIFTPTLTLHNIDGGATCGTGPGDHTMTNPLLGSLGNNGGPTETEPLLPGSPAIGAGDNAYAPATDQRGLPRVSSTDPTSDIGAYQVQRTLLNPSVPSTGANPIASDQVPWIGLGMFLLGVTTLRVGGVRRRPAWRRHRH